MKMKNKNLYSRYCVVCGSELIIGGNDMLSDIDESIKNDKDDAMVTNASCPICKANYTMYDATENEMDEDESFVGRMEIYR